VHVVIGTESCDATSYRCTRDPMKKQKVKNGSIGTTPVELLIFRYVDADFLTRPWCQHIFLLSLESSLTYQKLGGTTQKSSALMNSMFQLFQEAFKLLFQLCSISFDDFVNQRSQTQWDKFLHLPAVLQAKSALTLHPLREHGPLKLLRELTQASDFLFEDAMTQGAFVTVHFPHQRRLQHFQEDGRDAFPRRGARNLCPGSSERPPVKIAYAQI